MNSKMCNRSFHFEINNMSSPAICNVCIICMAWWLRSLCQQGLYGTEPRSQLRSRYVSVLLFEWVYKGTFHNTSYPVKCMAAWACLSRCCSPSMSPGRFVRKLCLSFIIHSTNRPCSLAIWRIMNALSGRRPSFWKRRKMTEALLQSHN